MTSERREETNLYPKATVQEAEKRFGPEIEKRVIVRFDVEGIHFWTQAPEEYAILRNEHGHIFHFEVQIEVGDSNREVEFLHARRQIMARIVGLFGAGSLTHLSNFGSRSCEMIAEELGNNLIEIFKWSIREVSVFEDQFVGGRVIWK